MAKAGRPSKFTDEIRRTILQAISIGATYKDAAEAAGIDYDTFNLWMKRGNEDSTSKYFEFFGQVRQTEAQARLKYLAVLADASRRGDWKAALEYLKRRDRKNWGDNVDITSKGGAVTWKDFINGDSTSDSDSESDN